MHITDHEQIRQTLRSYMFHPEQQSAPFLAEIRVLPGADWNGHTIPKGGLVIEGARPFGAATGPDGDTLFSLTNSDSNYCGRVGAVRLSTIQKLDR